MELATEQALKLIVFQLRRAASNNIKVDCNQFADAIDEAINLEYEDKLDLEMFDDSEM